MIIPKFSEAKKYDYSLTETIKESISSRWIKGFEAAKVALQDSDGEKNRDKMGAAIFSGATLLSIGHNQYAKTSTKNIIKNKKGKTFIMGIHAEQSALLKIRYRDYSKKKLTCYVVRTKANGDLTVSKPCEMCISSMKEAGIKVIRFINSDGIPSEIIL